MARKDKSSSKKNTNKIRKVLLIWGGIIMLFIVLYLFYSMKINVQKQGLDDVFEFLEQKGYTVNHGFSGIYLPGNIIQVIQMQDGKEVPLDIPILVLSGKDCFPDKEPVKAPFTLPDYIGSSSAQFKAGAKSMAALLPDLALDSKTVADYSLKFGNIQSIVFAKLDISRKFSDQCVNDLRNALADGDKLGWIKVIQEAVVADSIIFEINWKSGTSAEARKNIEENALRKIDKIFQSNDKNEQAAEISSELRLDTDKKMVIEAKGIVVLAYKFRPLDKLNNTAQNNFSATGDRKQDKPQVNMISGETDTKKPHGDRSKIAVQLIRKNGTRIVKFDHPFVKGDKFRFEVMPGQDGNLYIFHKKPGKNIELLWPRPEEILSGRQDYPVKQGKVVEIPPSPAEYFFDEELNEERFYVAIASKQNQSSMQKEIENFAVRGKNPENETQRIGYDTGQDSQEPYLQFSETLKESKGEVVEFRLGR
ncbi:MAG: hypothetical protein ABIK92_07310 [Pseudomonadota bacterium]